MLENEGEEDEEEEVSSKQEEESVFETCDEESVFSDLTAEKEGESLLPEWVNVAELLTDIESHLGQQAHQQLQSMLTNCALIPEQVNVRELLSEIQEELDRPYFHNLLLKCYNQQVSGMVPPKKRRNNIPTSSPSPAAAAPARDIVTSAAITQRTWQKKKLSKAENWQPTSIEEEDSWQEFSNTVPRNLPLHSYCSPGVWN